MFNVTIVGNEPACPDPLAILAGVAAEDANDPERSESDGAQREPDVDEYHVMWAAYRALCESRGLRAIGSYEVTWVLYCLGALDSAVGWFHLGGYFAPYAWPERRVALMLSIPLSSFQEDSPEALLEMAIHEEARDAVFQEEGWLVVRIDPCSRRLDDQLEVLAALVAAQTPNPAS